VKWNGLVTIQGGDKGRRMEEGGVVATNFSNETPCLEKRNKEDSTIRGSREQVPLCKNEHAVGEVFLPGVIAPRL